MDDEIVKVDNADSYMVEQLEEQIKRLNYRLGEKDHIIKGLSSESRNLVAILEDIIQKLTWSEKSYYERIREVIDIINDVLKGYDDYIS